MLIKNKTYHLTVRTRHSNPGGEGRGKPRQPLGYPDDTILSIADILYFLLIMNSNNIIRGPCFRRPGKAPCSSGSDKLIITRRVHVKTPGWYSSVKGYFSIKYLAPILYI